MGKDLSKHRGFGGNAMQSTTSFYTLLFCSLVYHHPVLVSTLFHIATALLQNLKRQKTYPLFGQIPNEQIQF